MFKPADCVVDSIFTSEAIDASSHNNPLFPTYTRTHTYTHIYDYLKRSRLIEGTATCYVEHCDVCLCV